MGCPQFEFDGWRPYRPGWLEAWEAAGRPSLGRSGGGGGVRRPLVRGNCDEHRSVVATELNPERAVGVTVTPHMPTGRCHGIGPP